MIWPGSGKAINAGMTSGVFLPLSKKEKSILKVSLYREKVLQLSCSVMTLIKHQM